MVVDMEVATAVQVLKSARLRDVIGQASSSSNELDARDAVFRFLNMVAVADNDADEEEREVDAAVSLALTQTNGVGDEGLYSLLLASQVLARRLQLGRLRHLASSFADLSSQLQGQRPFLSLTLSAMSSYLAGNRGRALTVLVYSLGLSNQNEPSMMPVRRTPESVAELYIASALMRWLEQGESAQFKSASRLALEIGDGVLLALGEFLDDYIKASSVLDLQSRILEQDATFDTEDGRSYLLSKQFKELLLPQEFAISRDLLSTESFLVSMPTSSGKTLLAELRIWIELKKNPLGRVIYVTPYRLLASQIETNLRKGLQGSGITVLDMGSLYDLTLEEDALQGALPDVAIVTPERLDAIVRIANSERNGGEKAQQLMESTVLIILDEVQVLARAGRGPKLELLFSRLRRLLPEVRLLALSALAGGVEPLSEWLGCHPIVFDGIRPTGLIEAVWNPNGTILQRTGEGVFRAARRSRPKSKAAIDLAAELICDIPFDYAPVLILESQRDYAESVLVRIEQFGTRIGTRWRTLLTHSQRTLLDSTANLVETTLGEQSNLPRLMRQGLVFHHAGLPATILRAIEKLVQEGAVRVMAATTTVAEGAHLPFRVVILPHLNFSGEGRKLDRSLYQNIVGRAGRIDTAIEGVVIILGSSSKSLAGYVENSLWSIAAPHTLTSHLDQIMSKPVDMDDYRAKRDARNQIIAWLGDEGSYQERQPQALLDQTLAKLTLPRRRTEALEAFFASTFEELESNGIAIAASPYRLTEQGLKVRLSGLSPRSAFRLMDVVDSEAVATLLAALDSTVTLDRSTSELISSLLFETEEMIDRSLWFQSHVSTMSLAGEEQIPVLRELMNGKLAWPYDDEMYRLDIWTFSAWLQGFNFETLGSRVVAFKTRGSFSSENPAKKSADIASHLIRIRDPAVWAWNGVQALMPDDVFIPPWVRFSIELGVPSQSAVELIRRARLSRDGAVLLAQALSPRWRQAESFLLEMLDSDLRDIGLSTLDLGAAQAYRDASLT